MRLKTSEDAMRNFFDARVSIAAAAGAASCLLLLSPAEARAQGASSRVRMTERRVETMRRQAGQYERDHPNHEGAAADPRDRKRAQELERQIRQDFEGLQAGYNKIVLATAAGARPDAETIPNAVAEVRERAARLRVNLALPKAKEGAGRKAQAVPPEPKQAEPPLTALLKHIYSFVTNPLFEAPSALNVGQAERAARDLDMIVVLSDGIRRDGAPKGRPD